MKRLWYKFIFWTRELRGNCYVCNKKKENHPDCYHCKANSLMCHSCNKLWNHGRAYGADAETISKVLQRLY